MRNAVDHLDLPPAGVDGAVMEPAKQRAVVSMGRTASRMLLDMVDFAPLRRHLATGDETSAVANGDRSPLVVIEDPVGCRQRHDAAARPQDDPLHRTGACDVPRDRERNRLIVAWDPRQALVLCEVRLSHRDDEGRRGAAEHRQTPGGCGRRQQDGQSIVLLLRGAARVRRGLNRLISIVRIVFDEAGADNRYPVDARIEHTVEPALQLCPNLGQQLTAHRHEAVVVAAPDSEPALSKCPRLVGFGAVLIQIGRPYGRVGAELVRGCRGCGIRALTTCSRPELFVGCEQLRAARGASAEGAHHGEHAVDADLAVEQGRPQRRELGGQHLAGRQRRALLHCLRGDHDGSCRAP